MQLDNQLTLDTPLASTMEALRLIETWRTQHLLDMEYTYFSKAHDCSSRIDYMFFTNDTFSLLLQSVIHDILILDHASVSVTLSDILPKPDFILWRFPSALAKGFRRMVRQTLEMYVIDNAQHRSNPNLFREVVKAHLKGRIISYTSACREQASAEYQEAGLALRLAQ